MQDLTFVGLSEDGSHLVLALADGRRFGLAIDERLRAAVRAAARTAAADAEDSGMRPRDVQARLRAGATVEEVADMAGWPVERVEAFGVPVLQERSFVATKAQRALIRHGDGERELQDVVVHRLTERGTESADLRWDAWRRDDGIWTVLMAYPAGRGDRVATWTFDTESRTLHPLDDEAAWLMESAPAPQSDAAAGPADSGSGGTPADSGAQVVSFTSGRSRPADQEQPGRQPAGRRLPGGEAAPGPQSAPGAAPGQPEARGGSARRTSVPSWDDILFGAPQEP